MAERPTPKGPADQGRDRPGNDQVEHQPGGLSERLDEKTRRNIGDDDNRNYPAEDPAEKLRKNHIRIARDIEKVKVTVNQPLRSDDPEADRSEGKHDRVMDGDAEPEGNEIEDNRPGAWHDMQLPERKDDDDRRRSAR